MCQRTVFFFCFSVRPCVCVCVLRVGQTALSSSSRKNKNGIAVLHPNANASICLLYVRTSLQPRRSAVTSQVYHHQSENFAVCKKILVRRRKDLDEIDRSIDRSVWFGFFLSLLLSVSCLILVFLTTLCQVHRMRHSSDVPVSPSQSMPVLDTDSVSCVLGYTVQVHNISFTL
jgi:hypothetical protein